jgi:hypothetical protein
LILQCYWAFVKFDFSKEEPKYKAMQKIANAYVAILSLDVVHGAQVSDQVESYGAHMNVNFVPVDMFERWFDTRGRDNLKEYPKSTGIIMKGLPFLVGEGTGMYEPLGFDFGPQLEAMRYAYGSCRSLEQFKKPILHQRNEPGNFFVASLVGMTDYYYRRGLAKKPLGFWYVTDKNTRGVLYTSMMKNDSCVGIKVHPEIPDTVMEIIEETIRKRVPPKGLVLTKPELVKTTKSKNNSILDHVLGQVKKTNLKPEIRIPVFLRPHQIVKQLGETMINDFKKLPRVKGLAYHLEEITNEIWGYKLLIYFE